MLTDQILLGLANIYQGHSLGEVRAILHSMWIPELLKLNGHSLCLESNGMKYQYYNQLSHHIDNILGEIDGQWSGYRQFRNERKGSNYLSVETPRLCGCKDDFDCSS